MQVEEDRNLYEDAIALLKRTRALSLMKGDPWNGSNLLDDLLADMDEFLEAADVAKLTAD
jgi:hypothetical protein